MPDSPHPTDRTAQAATLLRESRRLHTRLEGLPAELRPATVAEGLAVQAKLVEQAQAESGARVAGWKLGGTTAGTRSAFGTEEVFFGTLLEGMLYESPAGFRAGDFFQLGIEPEISLVLSRDIAPRENPYTPPELADFVEKARLSIEVPNSCIGNAVGAGLPTLLADNCGAGALVLGPPVEDWLSRVENVPVALRSGGKELAAGSTADVLGGPLHALAAFANRFTSRGGKLHAGSVIATGGCTPYTLVEPDAPVVASFGALGTVEVTFHSNGASK